MKSLRPATAGSMRSAMDHRPLGRSPMPVRLQAAVTTNNIQAQIAALKGEILMLQHRFQETRLQGECHHDMEAIERKLMTLNAVFPDDGSTNYDVKCTLLEILVEQIKSISSAALERAGPLQNFSELKPVGGLMNSGSIPSRTHGFLKLVDFVVNVADRKRVWDARVEVEASKSDMLISKTPSDHADDFATAAVKAAEMNVIDLAMNEPTAAEVRKLVAEQKQLQEQIKAMLQKNAGDSRGPRKSLVPGSAAAAAAVGQSALNGSTTSSHLIAHGQGSATTPRQQQPTTPTTTGGAADQPAAGARSSEHITMIANLQAKIDGLMSENGDCKKRILQLEQALKDSAQTEKIESDEVPADVAKRVRGLAFGVDYNRLVELGVQVSAKPVMSDDSALLFSQKMSTLLAEFSPAYNQQLQNLGASINASPAKGGAPDKQRLNSAQAAAQAAAAVGNPSVMEGLLWGTLHQQSQILTASLDKNAAIQQSLTTTINERVGEIDRLQRVIATLEQRIQLLKVQATKNTLAMEAEAQRIKKEGDRFKKLYEDHLMSDKNTTKRIVNAKGQIATAEERERTLKEEIASRQQSIGDLTEQLKALKSRLEEEQTASAAIARERQGLLQARDTEASKVGRLQLEAKDREEALQNAKESLLLLKKEMRDKNVAETETQQKTWKLEVELHIAQNVISELRQREAELSKIAKDAESCREELQEDVHRLRDEIADNQAQMNRRLEDAKQELGAAKSMLKDERHKLMTQENEVERLRIVDLKMQSLEQNFTNYAASKIAQREAGEEEERMLGACLEALDTDPFTIPQEREGEAQLQLYMRELQTAKEQYEVEERLRKRGGGSGGKSGGACAKPQDDESSNKKKLVLLLKSRLTDIQLFSCRSRLQQMNLERQNRNQALELRQLKASQETLLQELSQLRLQCESLAHRNSELEIERKLFHKQRSAMELEAKNLKANAQRLRVSHDEQEKLLVDMGTKLQTARMGQGDASTSSSPLPGAVIGVD